MAMKPSWQPLGAGELNEWRALVSDYPGQPYYKLVEHDQLPNSIPQGLRDKINHAVLMASGTLDGDVMMVCNLCRIDEKDSAIDQQPFAVVFDSHGNAESGVYANHGDWQDRTVKPPKPFWDVVAASGVGSYVYPEIPAGSESGLLADVPESSHGHAFNEMIQQVRTRGYLGGSDST